MHIIISWLHIPQPLLLNHTRIPLRIHLLEDQAVPLINQISTIFMLTLHIIKVSLTAIAYSPLASKSRKRLRLLHCHCRMYQQPHLDLSLCKSPCQSLHLLQARKRSLQCQQSEAQDVPASGLMVRSLARSARITM